MFKFIDLPIYSVLIPIEGTKLNPDTEYVKKMIDSLSKTEGYCPCIPRRLWNDDTKCQCKKYRETLECGCLLYVKE